MPLETILTAARLAQTLHLAAPEGDAAQRTFERITVLGEAGPRDISFASDAKYLASLATTRAGLLLCPERIAADVRAALPAGWSGVLLPVPDIWAAVLHVLDFFHPSPRAEGDIHPTAVVDPSARYTHPVDIGPHAVVGGRARLAPGVILGPGVVVGEEVEIGEGTIVQANAVLCDRTIVGARCVIGPGVVLGAAGFKYEMIRGVRTHIPQVGRVVVEDDVEIGANTTIDRASFTETRIGARTKIDNLVQVGHNCVVGPDSVLCAQVGIAGSSRLGRGNILAGQVGVADNVALADDVVLLGQSGVGQDIEKGGFYMGSPCVPRREHHRIWQASRRLPELLARLAGLERKPGDPSGGA